MMMFGSSLHAPHKQLDEILGLHDRDFSLSNTPTLYVFPQAEALAHVRFSLKDQEGVYGCFHPTVLDRAWRAGIPTILCRMDGGPIHKSSQSGRIRLDRMDWFDADAQIARLDQLPTFEDI